MAQRQVEAATFIVDAYVLGYSRHGLVVSVLRQFKGPRRASLFLLPDHCGDLVPPPGRYARLLVKDNKAFSVSASHRAQLRLYEQTVDRLIGAPRAAASYSEAENFPPDPEP